MQEKFFEKICEHLKDLKLQIFKNDDPPNNLMPFLHILLQIVIYNRFRDTKQMYKRIGDELDELRMLPLPYGLLAHELIEVLD